MDEFHLGISFLGVDQQGLLMVVGATLLLCVSALVSGTETAFFSLSHGDLRELKSSNDGGSVATLRLLKDVDMLLATVLVVNNLVNICIVILTSGAIQHMFHFTRFEFLFKTVFVTFLLLLFGEIMPKVFAQSIPRKFAVFMSRPMALLKTIFYPLSYVLVRASTSISERASHRSEISIDELADAVDMTHNTTKEEHEMLAGIVNFVNTEVVEIMKVRVDITALDITTPFEQIKRTIIETGYSRLPIYDQDIDNIVGILYVKDLLSNINSDDDFEWQQYLRKPYFIPEHKKISDLLEEFQSSKVHLAIVVDEYGSTLGLISLEDIIEEIIGEISDESDVDQTLFTKIDQNSYLFEGKTHIGDFEKALELEEDSFEQERGEAETLAGMLIEMKRNFLKIGDVVVVRDIKFTVYSVEGRRIDKIKVELKPRE